MEVAKLVNGIRWLVKLPPIWGVLMNARYTFILKIGNLGYNRGRVDYGCI